VRSPSARSAATVRRIVTADDPTTVPQPSVRPFGRLQCGDRLGFDGRYDVGNAHDRLDGVSTDLQFRNRSRIATGDNLVAPPSEPSCRPSSRTVRAPTPGEAVRELCRRRCVLRLVIGWECIDLPQCSNPSQFRQMAPIGDRRSVEVAFASRHYSLPVSCSS
jgi:hypothetical protein